jgi:hypothetical protein
MIDIQELPKTLTSVCKQFVLASDVYVAIRAYIPYIWTPYFFLGGGSVFWKQLWRCNETIRISNW